MTDEINECNKQKLNVRGISVQTIFLCHHDIYLLSNPGLYISKQIYLVLIKRETIIVLNNFIDYKVTYSITHKKYFQCHFKLIDTCLLYFTKGIIYI